MTVELTRQFPVLPVRDVAKAQAFYRDVLGFRIDWIERDEVGCVSNGAISVFLKKAASTPAPHELVWNTTDADRVLDIYRANGATIVEDIETRSWGMREFVVQDLDGHCMRVGHVDESNADYSGFAFTGESC